MQFYELLRLYKNKVNHKNVQKQCHAITHTAEQLPNDKINELESVDNNICTCAVIVLGKKL